MRWCSNPDPDVLEVSPRQLHQPEAYARSALGHRGRASGVTSAAFDWREPARRENLLPPVVSLASNRSVGDSNNHLAGRIPKVAYPTLESFETLLGTREVGGGCMTGQVHFEWLRGYFLVQRVNISHVERAIEGVAYIGYDEDTATLRSHFMDNNGSSFTYTWEVLGDRISTRFGEKGSNNHFEGCYAPDFLSFSRERQWPGGGFKAVMRHRWRTNASRLTFHRTGRGEFDRAPPCCHTSGTCRRSSRRSSRRTVLCYLSDVRHDLHRL